jgi:ABC-2 type transport system permease protein
MVELGAKPGARSRLMDGVAAAAVYLRMAGMMVQAGYAYRWQIAIELASTLLQIYLLRVVWTAVYAGRESVAGVPLPALIAYLTLAALQSHAMFPNLAYFIEERVHSGQIAVDLARPVPFLGQMLAWQVGVTAAQLPFIAIAFPFAVLFGGITLPASPAAAGLYALSLLLAYAVVVLTGVLIGLLAFWTVQVNAFVVIYSFVSRFFAGALMPLTFFPEALRSIAELLPFQSQVFLPIGIYLGQIEGAAAARALGVQLFWVGLLAVLVRLGWSRALRRTIVQGG